MVLLCYITWGPLARRNGHYSTPLLNGLWALGSRYKSNIATTVAASASVQFHLPLFFLLSSSCRPFSSRIIRSNITRYSNFVEQMIERCAEAISV